MNREESVFPFAAVVGQDQVKLALLLNAVNHEVGGVLIRGRRGTAKSTLARGLAHLLPEIDVVNDCPFSCDPRDIESLCGYCAGNLALEGSLSAGKSRMRIVTLPLNATEEMVVGTLDIEKALRRGERAFDPGILAKANRAILYVDEVNLLEDHIVDILLDSAAMGVNVVEREGISFRHGARFILVGTMNPEEGDLRPQLEDRFGLCAEVEGQVNASERAEILRRNLQFARTPLEFESRWHPEQEALRCRIVAARERYGSIEVPEPMLDAVATIVDRAGADGHRADLAMLHSARALAAFEKRDEVDINDVARVAGLALNHRVRRGPLGMEDGRDLDIPALLKGLTAAEQVELPGFTEPEPAGVEQETGRVTRPAAQAEPASEPVAPAFEEVAIPESREPGLLIPGKRGRPLSADANRGRYYRSASPSGSRQLAPSDIAIDATIRASAARAAGEEGKPEVLPEDIKVKLRKRKCGSSILFVVDASASMGAKKRLEASRQAILALLVEAYQKRDRVGLVVFKDDAAQLVMSPTSSPALAGRLLGELAPGGTTPLSHGLALGYQVLERELSRSPQPAPVLVLISDGGGNVTMGSSDPIREAVDIAREIRDRGIRSIVLDSAPRPQGSPLGDRPTAARRIADALAGAYFPARNISGEAIVEKVVRATSREPAATPGTAALNRE
ncbi:MAG: VWA domain-containing protein [Candidatus Geothermincolia bacterium]